jgi:hypothetical protein
VHDAPLVRRVERGGDLTREADRFSGRKRPRGEAVGQRRPFDELEYQRTDAVYFLEAVDGADVRMIERREQSRLARESCSPIGIRDQPARQDFDRDVARELGVVARYTSPIPPAPRFSTMR